MTITVVTVVVSMVISMMLGVRIRGVNSNTTVQPIHSMHVMKMDAGSDVHTTKKLKNSNKNQSGTVFKELIHG